jgi:flavoprotein
MSATAKQRIVVAMTGATGAIYGVRLLEELRRGGRVETHVVISRAGQLSAAAELDLGRREIEALGDVAHSDRDIGASVASGSFKTEGMIVAPCSMRTLAAIATGVTDNLVLDGRILTELIDPAWLVSHPVRQGTELAQHPAKAISQDLSEEEEASVEDQLRRLGYI